MKKPDIILFDWDNTLADTWSIIHKSLEKTFQIMGHKPMTIEEVVRGDKGIHGSLRNSFPKIFADNWQKARQHYFDSFLEVHLDEISVMVGAEDVLKEIKSKGIDLCIVSNKTGAYLREEVQHLGWENYFIDIIGATDAQDDKPSHHPVELAVANLPVQFDVNSHQENIWLVGDSKTDLETAKNAKITPVLFGDNKDAVDYHMASDDDNKIHVRDHMELLNVVKGL